jgi:hypothetical protein
MAGATFVTFFAVTYTAMITRMINGELNYRIPASHSNHMPRGTMGRHVFLSLCVARYLSIHLLKLSLSHKTPRLLLISLSQRTNFPLSSQNFFCLQDRTFNMSRILYSICSLCTYMYTNIWSETSARL